MLICTCQEIFATSRKTKCHLHIVHHYLHYYIIRRSLIVWWRSNIKCGFKKKIMELVKNTGFTKTRNRLKTGTGKITGFLKCWFLYKLEWKITIKWLVPTIWILEKYSLKLWRFGKIKDWLIKPFNHLYISIMIIYYINLLLVKKDFFPRSDIRGTSFAFAQPTSSFCSINWDQ